ncbi:uncharacterized protein [Euphorbia lathyris]|uniref:uncharacterized protein n=1 Tax=Euphorbia lathyris TaxID=212925 RepID=UPI003314489C
MGSSNSLWSLTKRCFTVGIIAVTISDRYASVVVVRETSMSPTLNPRTSTTSKSFVDDRVLVEKFCTSNYKFSHGDVIVFCSPLNHKERFIKRIIGLPGDWIGTQSGDMEKVPEGRCWVEGDNLLSSMDSRYFGPVPLGLIKGRVTHIVWPPSRIGFWAHICTNYPKEHQELAATICWSLWLARNFWLWQQRADPATIIFSTATAFLSKWKQAQLKACIVSSPNPPAAANWNPPPAGMVKINFDAAVFQGSLGYGFIERDDFGNFRACGNGGVSGPPDPLLAEALAFREMLQWAKEQNRANVHFETDSQLLAQLFHKLLPVNSPLGVIIGDCKVLFQSLDNSCLSFVLRSTNQAAHVLARAAGSLSGCREWFLTPPPILCHSILNN